MTGQLIRRFKRRPHRVRGCGVRCAATVAMLPITMAGLAPTPSASAGADLLKGAVAAQRASSCGPLRENPAVQQAAENISESNNRWLDHASRAEPESDALPLLKDLGYGGTKSAILFGTALTEADSIKALMLQGYAKIPDCSFTDFGASVLQANSAGWVVSIVVLAA